ncbi:unnamed protein product [Macrosiphum euphorbiae]|uniref:Helitron helicase-like domain-containing protein n=1 Tax=Macrosiphum euphorbiae TaxID=13131 RepID=A0AAV0WSV0_9HEMI|nr:unnamed protein product [Macrosiphum euphorbiae]
MNLLTKNYIFGEVQSWVYSIEWQKRGLPHAHILIWLKNKIHADQIDKIISAEFPDPDADQILFNIMKKHDTWAMWKLKSKMPVHERWKM